MLLGDLRKLYRILVTTPIETRTEDRGRGETPTAPALLAVCSQLQGGCVLPSTVQLPCYVIPTVCQVASSHWPVLSLTVLFYLVSDFGRMWGDLVVVCCRMLSQTSSGGTEEDEEEFQTRDLTSSSRTWPVEYKRCSPPHSECLHCLMSYQNCYEQVYWFRRRVLQIFARFHI
jgi:hypothetical protein